MKRKLSLAMLLTLSATASPVSLALGLGDAQVQSSLNAPLRATIPLTDTQGVEARLLRVELADDRAFERAGLSRNRLADSIEFSVEKGRQGLTLTLRSERAVRDPYLDLLLALEWPGGQQLRHITLLFDPVDYAALPALVEDASRNANEGQPDRRRSEPLVGDDGGAHQAEIRSGDTLWGVASRVRPNDHVSLPQVMLALVEANPEAFPSGNINEMRAGAVLTVPTQAAIERRSREEADRLVEAHHHAWTTRGEAPTVTSHVPVTQVAESADMDANAETVEQEPSQRLTLLSDADLAAERDATADDAAAATAQATGSDEAPPIDARLLQLEDQLLANQQALQAVREERDSLRAAMGELRGELVALRDQLATSTTGGDTGAPALGDGVDPVSEAPVAEPWWSALWQGMRHNTLALGGVAIALLLALWALRRRRHERDDDPTFTQPYDREAPTVVGPGWESRDSARGQRVPGGHHDGQDAPVRASMPQAEAISEADIFIAYGRFDQARELLEASLAAEPGRDDLRLKLLMVYAECGDREAALREASHLERHGDSELQAEVERLRARYGGTDRDRPADEQDMSSSAGEAVFTTPQAFPEASASPEVRTHAAAADMPSFESSPVVPPASKSNVIDYQPPPLDPEPEVRSETPMQPSVDFSSSSEPEAGAQDAAADPAGNGHEGRDAFPDAQWDVEEVAFEPLHLDNKGPAAASPEAAQRLVVLARQLLDEGESTQAHELLRQVLAHGDAPLKEEARDLIAQHNLD
ncbi:FimV/HubP family polar landmark protein [Litchfieldella rifensis]|uniref:FimV/HubP family polar landmark protein n=1 Tax=Litchfieldella rifensis TaxID=762643 RepID=A0ABV7LMP9_9GAMM